MAGIRHPDEVRSRFFEAVRSGEMTPVEAGRMAGISKQTAYKWLNEEGVDWTRARLDHLKALRFGYKGKTP